MNVKRLFCCEWFWICLVKCWGGVALNGLGWELVEKVGCVEDVRVKKFDKMKMKVVRCVGKVWV